MAETDQDTLRVREVAEYLQVHQGTVYEAVARGGLPSVRIGRSIRVPRAALEQWVAAETARSLRQPSEVAQASPERGV